MWPKTSAPVKGKIGQRANGILVKLSEFETCRAMTPMSRDEDQIVSYLNRGSCDRLSGHGMPSAKERHDELQNA
jgi:hypothetical protein